jgi:hypothetical protein
MLFQKLIKQHRVHCLVAHSREVSLFVARNQAFIAKVNVAGRFTCEYQFSETLGYCRA